MKSKFYTLMRHGALAVLAVFGLNEASAQYCTPTSTYGCTAGDYIQSFSTSNGTTNITNNGSGCNGTYTFFSTQTHTAVLNGVVNFSITNCPSYTEEYKIWVDYNNDQDFLDAGEEVWSSTGLSGGQTATGSFTVPPTAMPGTTRLRIRCAYYPASGWTSCSAETYAEAEDYNFVISGTPCTPPSGVLKTNVTSKTATVSWTGPGSILGYQYVLSTSSATPTVTPTSITASTFNASGLNPSTWYYVFIRTQCNASSISMWVKDSFKTLPPCQPPVGFKTTNLTPTSTTINWNVWPSAITYDYIVDQDRANPGSTTSLTNTANTSANITGLTEDTKYYVHIRSNCAFNENSDWSLDSFTTPIPCRAPVIKIDHINTTQAVAYWEAVPSATSYEYVLTKSATPPSIGTRYMYTSIHTSALADGEDYYIHARCSCTSQTIESISPWGTANFKTFPTGVTNVNKNDALIQVYPNPVKDVLIVATTGANHNGAAISITDVTGKVVRTATVAGEKTTVDMSGLTAGFYFVKYIEGDRKEVIKVMKQ